MSEQLILKKHADNLRESKPECPENIADNESGSENSFATREARYQIGQVVRHRLFDFRGVVFDVDPAFANTEEWYQAIPEEIRPTRDQPYYHLFAENESAHYVAYVSEQNLLAEHEDMRVDHPDMHAILEVTEAGYVLKAEHMN